MGGALSARYFFRYKRTGRGGALAGGIVLGAAVAVLWALLAFTEKYI
jgi:hypothetical protein